MTKRKLAFVCLALLFCGCLAFWRPTSYVASGTLEWRYDSARLEGDPEAIVVFSGTHARARYEHAAWLYTHWRRVPVLACVGGGHAEINGGACSASARRILSESGVPLSALWIEARSNNTYENAVDAADILKQKGIRRVALVTEAIHMLRAEKCFRRQGLDVIPAPCRYRAAHLADGWEQLVPQPAYLVENQQALHEWLGLGWYLVKGYL